MLLPANVAIDFIEQYMQMSSPHGGMANVLLHDYQKELLQYFEQESNHVINKSRQVGFSSLIAHYFVASAICSPAPLIMIVAEPSMTMKEDMFDTILCAYENIDTNALGYVPRTVVEATTAGNPYRLIFDNGSEIWVISTPNEMINSACNAIVFDEFDYFTVKDQADLWVSCLGLLTKHTLFIASSSPGSLAGTYGGLWKQSINSNSTAHGNFRPSIVLRLSTQSSAAIIDPRLMMVGNPTDSKDPKKAYDYAMKGI